MRRRLFAAALTALLMMMTASVCAAQEALGEDGLYAETPALLRLRQETVSETAEDGVTLRRTYPSTANALVDAQMRALVDDMAARGVALGEGAPQMTQLDVGAVVTRTGTQWMSFLTLAEATALCQQRSRNYAKRQLTWFRRNPDIRWLRLTGADDFSEVLSAARQNVPFSAL